MRGYYFITEAALSRAGNLSDVAAAVAAGVRVVQYRQKQGRTRDLVAEARASGARHVCVTGGEPLAQPNCADLLRQLCDAGLHVSIETSGAFDASQQRRQIDRGQFALDVTIPANVRATVTLPGATSALVDQVSLYRDLLSAPSKATPTSGTATAPSRWMATRPN